MLIESRNVMTFNEKFKIVYEKFHAPWPASDRDFIYVVKEYERGGGALIVAKSIDTGLADVDGVVRGDLKCSCFFLKKINNKSTEVTLFYCVDPKGLIPRCIIRNVNKKQCKCVGKIKKYMG